MDFPHMRCKVATSVFNGGVERHVFQFQRMSRKDGRRRFKFRIYRRRRSLAFAIGQLPFTRLVRKHRPWRATTTTPFA